MARFLRVNPVVHAVDSSGMEVVENVPVRLWSAVADECEYATFFHTPVWAQIVQSTYPHKYDIATRAFEFGADDWVVLPMMETEHELRGFFRRFSSNVFGVYGGVIATHPIDSGRVQRIIDYLHGVRVKKLDIVGNPYAPPEAELAVGERKENFTHNFPLENLSCEAEVLKAYTHSMPDHIRKAVRAGYVCSQAANIDDVKAYLAIYEEALARYGDAATGRQQPQLFLNIFRDGGDNAKLWLARKDGRVAGGVLAFYHRKHCVAWHASFSAGDLKYGVAKLLHHHVILNAIENGYSVYDFNPSGGHEGTVKFKEMFGAQQRTFSGFHWESNIYNIYRRVRAIAHIK